MASYEETLTNITLEADASIAVDTSPPVADGVNPAGFQYRFVQVTGDHQCGLYTNANGEVIVGVLQSKPQVVGHEATVAVSGVSMVEAAGAIATGDTVTADANGLATTGGTGSPAGIAIRPATAAGELIPVLLRLTTTGSTTA